MNESLNNFYRRIEAAVGVKIVPGDKSDTFFRRLLAQGLTPSFTTLAGKTITL
jgi:hypothetical protein